MKEKLSRISILSVGLLSLTVLAWGLLKYVIPVLLPFVIAWLIALITASPAASLSRRINVPKKVIRLILAVLGMIISFLALSLLVWQIITSLWQLLSDFAEQNSLYDLLSKLISSDSPILGGILPPKAAAWLKEAISGVVSRALEGTANSLASLATGLPRLLFFLVVTLISVIYFSLDYDKISAFFNRYLPKKITKAISFVGETAVFVIKKYVFSYSIILMITYFVIFIGLWLLKVKSAPSSALFIALLDVLPVIGVGTVLIPWSLLSFATGDKLLGIGLLVLFVVNTLIRQLAEPHIVGKNLNLPPLITLVSIYFGYSLFGIIGVIMIPLISVGTLAALKRNNSTKIH